MKKNFFKLASVAMTACFVCVVTFVFQSCNSDTDELIQKVAFEQGNYSLLFGNCFEGLSKM